METIIVKPENKSEPSKKAILKSIEQGAKETSLYLKGKIKLNDAKKLLNEL